MSQLLSHIESILFVASKPLSADVIAKALGKQEGDILEAIETLKLKYNQADSGIHILEINSLFQMGTNPENSAVIEGFIRNEVAGELTKAQLETLTVIAYRGPITRPELEQIRGVNCALIIRNLLIRGLIEEGESADKMMNVYSLSFDALRHLGVTSPSDLPAYDTLHAHPHVEAALGAEEEPS